MNIHALPDEILVLISAYATHEDSATKLVWKNVCKRWYVISDEHCNNVFCDAIYYGYRNVILWIMGLSDTFKIRMQNEIIFSEDADWYEWMEDQYEWHADVGIVAASVGNYEFLEFLIIRRGSLGIPNILFRADNKVLQWLKDQGINRCY